DSKSDDANRDDPTSLRDHLVEVIDGATEAARFLDDACEAIATVDAAAAFDELETIQEVPQTIVLDGTLQQRLLDLAAQRGVERIVATEHGEFVKQPIGTRILRSEQLLTPAEA
ncbi:MAG: DNA primase DnaG, partial [Halobacteriota archaeon]